MHRPDVVGQVQVYTGNGKGKTTCALGAAMRAAGHGLRVLMICFMKARVAHRGDGVEDNYGEYRTAEQIPNLRIVPVGREVFVDRRSPDPVDIQMAQDGLRMAQEALDRHECDVLILDEINVAVEWGLISLEEQLDLIRRRPSDIEIIMTGRYARRELLEAADLVTEMQEVKHYFKSKRLLARRGFEY